MTSSWQEILNDLDARFATICERIDHSRAKHEARRAEIERRYLEATGHAFHSRPKERQ